ncbi:MAG TPA: hypothetical protein VFX02_01135 [Gammaproteobacteria bacterium]|nr:hypothetical protein [Gammaproteobacteria bacterium]
MPRVLQKIRALLLLCLLTPAGPALADRADEKQFEACQRPEAPTILDGRSARQEQISEMRQAVVDFIGVNMTYRKCLERELALIGDNNSSKAQSIKAYIDEAITDSLDMDDLVADTFNTQLRIYKSLQK